MSSEMTSVELSTEEEFEWRVDNTTEATTPDPSCMSDCQRLENDYPCFNPILPCDRANPPTTADLEAIVANDPDCIGGKCLCDMELNMACMKVSKLA